MKIKIAVACGFLLLGALLTNTGFKWGVLVPIACVTSPNNLCAKQIGWNIEDFKVGRY
jgi:hypothetical protein